MSGWNNKTHFIEIFIELIPKVCREGEAQNKASHDTNPTPERSILRHLESEERKLKLIWKQKHNITTISLQIPGHWYMLCKCRIIESPNFKLILYSKQRPHTHTDRLCNRTPSESAELTVWYSTIRLPSQIHIPYTFPRFLKRSMFQNTVTL